jgi:hypothetical protein
MIFVTRVDFRAIFFCFTGISRSADLSHLKPFSIAFDKCPAGATSNAGGNGEPLKYFYKLANPSDRIYITLSRRFSY